MLKCIELHGISCGMGRAKCKRCYFDLEGGEKGAELSSVEAALYCGLISWEAGPKLIDNPLDQLPAAQMRGR